MQHEVTNGRSNGRANGRYPICNMKLPMAGTLYET